MLFGGVAEVIENHPGLHTGDASLGIDLNNISHVLGEIEDDGDVAALSGERSASATAKKGSAEFAADRDGSAHIVGVVRQNHPDRDLAIVGAVGCIQGPAAVVEANFAANLRPERLA